MSAPPCPICATPTTPLLRLERALTSIRESVPTGIDVSICPGCAHATTRAASSGDAYYRDTYRLLAEERDEDQLYDAGATPPVYRAQHQAKLALERLRLPQGARVLDFGGAKGATLLQMLRARPDIDAHIFEVTDDYQRFWSAFLAPERCATTALPDAWRGCFDAIVSTFVFEHVRDAVRIARDLSAFLRPGGELLVTVPNADTNSGDLLVADHVHHFSASSLQVWAEAAGLEVQRIDAEAHRGAFLAHLRRPTGSSLARALSAPARPSAAQITAQRASREASAARWMRFADELRAFESRTPGRAAIYGAGFYGSFLCHQLAHTQPAVFVDRNPWLHGRQLHGAPIVAPDALPRDVEVLYVGLNPRVARDAARAALGERLDDLTCFFPPLAPTHAVDRAAGERLEAAC